KPRSQCCGIASARISRPKPKARPPRTWCKCCYKRWASPSRRNMPAPGGNSKAFRDSFMRTRVACIAAALCGLVVLACSDKNKPSVANSLAPEWVESGDRQPPYFDDLTKVSGIDFTYRNGEEAGHLTLLETLGGGVGL